MYTDLLRTKRSLQLNSPEMHDLDNLAIENFREYLRIPSVHSNVNYAECVSFIKSQAESMELPVQVHHCFADKPIVVISWVGQEPTLPSILLNGHMDVVPVFTDKWAHDPFGAEMDDHGNIYGRGAQDMKCMSIQYLEAIRRLMKSNVTLKRTVHISFVSDEEIGGAEGMQAFIKSNEFKELNVGFALDEGIASSEDAFSVYNGERTLWFMHVHCQGQPGHGSLLLDNTAGEKAKRILDKFYEFRAQERKKLDDDPCLGWGDVTSINLTMIKGGVQTNVIPTEFILSFDCRIAPMVDLAEFEQTLNKWCEEAGEGVHIEYGQKEEAKPVTKLDETNHYWMAFKQAADNMHLELKPHILMGGTDSRFLRAVGIPALGFAPMNNTPFLAHDHNECINKDVFLNGIEIYYEIITSIGNVEEK